MKPRIRSLSNLYHRWGRDLGMDAERIAQVLELTRIIRRVDSVSYVELPRDPVLSPEAYDKYVRDILITSERQDL